MHDFQFQKKMKHPNNSSLLVEIGQGKQGIQRFCIPKKNCTPPNNMYNTLYNLEIKWGTQLGSPKKNICISHEYHGNN